MKRLPNIWNGLFILATGFLLHSCFYTPYPKERYTGVCFTAPPKPLHDTGFRSVTQINANAIALIPYAYINPEKDRVIFDSEHQWWGERKEGIGYCIEQAHSASLKVMLKPHIWLSGGFHGDYLPKDEKAWDSFSETYTDYLLTYAQIAEKYQVDLLCIGTEMKKVALSNPNFWKTLITKIREIYHGKLTYAANWDSYHSIEFWEDLDYISVDAYFPLSSSKTPEIDELTHSWAPYRQELKKISVKFHKQIIFAEFGYRSVDYNCSEPWDSSHKKGVNLKAQENAYTALFETFMNEDWFAGGFVWKWFDHHESA